MEIQELKFEIEQARRNEQMTGTILQEQQARQELLKRDQTQYQEQIETLKVEAEQLTTQFNEKNEIYQNSNSRIQDVDQELTTQRRELFAAGQSESSLDARVNSLNAQIQDLQDRHQNEEQVLAELREKKISFEDRRRKVFNDLEKERQLQLDLSNDVVSYEANKKNSDRTSCRKENSD